jgi:phosphoribosylamine--glycine ligase
MQVLIVGGGGREHAIAWKAAQSSQLQKLYLAPGNAGTRSIGENLAIAPDDFASLCSFALQRKIDLVLVGPEAPLAGGLADHLSQEGIPVFGPTQKAAQIEASKAFAKAFMERHAIPTARYAVFADFESAREYLKQVNDPIVIKASGLAAGKGVVLPGSLEEAEADLRSMLVDQQFGAASRQVVIEERLEEKKSLCWRLPTASRCARCRLPRITSACWMVTGDQIRGAWGPMRQCRSAQQKW